jgi:hypothetical protein
MHLLLDQMGKQYLVQQHVRLELLMKELNVPRFQQQLVRLLLLVFELLEQQRHGLFSQQKQ